MRRDGPSAGAGACGPGRAPAAGSPRERLSVLEAVAMSLPSVRLRDADPPAVEPGAGAAGARALPPPKPGARAAGVQADAMPGAAGLAAALAALEPARRRGHTPARGRAEAQVEREELMALIRDWRVEEGLGWGGIAARLPERERYGG